MTTGIVFSYCLKAQITVRCCVNKVLTLGIVPRLFLFVKQFCDKYLKLLDKPRKSWYNPLRMYYNLFKPTEAQMKFSPAKARARLAILNEPQRWLAEQSGLAPNTVSKFLSSDEPVEHISLVTVNSLARALRCNSIDLCDIETDPAPHRDAPAGVAVQ